MKYKVDLQDTIAEDTPNRFHIQRWVNETLDDLVDNGELCIRIVDSSESQALNKQYRDKDKPTNVLSFPSELPDEIKAETHILGDIVICAQIVKGEAEVQTKKLEAHWAHMVVHGTLHLLGFDHINDRDAKIMESLEINILQRLGFPNPYIGDNHE